MFFDCAEERTRRPGQRRGSCRSSRRGRAVLSSTTACTSPRTRWRSSRARCRSGPSFLASFEARVCVSASACLLCVSALRGCLGREIKPHSVLRPLRTPGRPRAGAVARVPFGRCHIHALRATWTSASRFEVRGRRVCLWLRPLYCLSLCVFIDLLRSPSLRRDGVDCACGCAQKYNQIVRIVRIVRLIRVSRMSPSLRRVEYAIFLLYILSAKVGVT